MPRYLGVDYGTKRIGLAISDAGAVISSPLTVIEVRGSIKDHAEAVVKAAARHEPEAFVVGLPFNMDGSEGEQARLTRRFGEALAALTGKDVHYVDERLSSISAESVLAQAGLTRKKRKARLDSLAAQSLLQEFLEKRNPPAPDAAQPEADDD